MKKKRKEQTEKKETYSIAACHSFWPFTFFECVWHITRLLLSSFLSSTRTAQIIDFIQKGHCFCLPVRYINDVFHVKKSPKNICIHICAVCVIYIHAEKKKRERSTSYHSRSVTCLITHGRWFRRRVLFTRSIFSDEASRWGKIVKYHRKIVRCITFGNLPFRIDLLR